MTTSVASLVPATTFRKTSNNDCSCIPPESGFGCSAPNHESRLQAAAAAAAASAAVKSPSKVGRSTGSPRMNNGSKTLTSGAPARPSSSLNNGSKPLASPAFATGDNCARPPGDASASSVQRVLPVNSGEHKSCLDGPPATTADYSPLVALRGQGSSPNGRLIDYGVIKPSKALSEEPAEIPVHSTLAISSGGQGRPESLNTLVNSIVSSSESVESVNTLPAVDPGQARSDGCFGGYLQSLGESSQIFAVSPFVTRFSSQVHTRPGDADEHSHDEVADVHDVLHGGASLSRNEQRTVAYYELLLQGLDYPDKPMRYFGRPQVAGASIKASALHQLYSEPLLVIGIVVTGHSLGGCVVSVLSSLLFFASLKGKIAGLALITPGGASLNGLEESLLSKTFYQTHETGAKWFKDTNHDRDWRNAAWNDTRYYSFRRNNSSATFIECLPDFEDLCHLLERGVTCKEGPVDNCFSGYRSNGKSPVRLCSSSLKVREHMQAELSQTSSLFIQIVRRAGKPELLKCQTVTGEEKRDVRDQWTSGDRDPAQRDSWSFFINCIDHGRSSQSPVFCLEQLSKVFGEASQQNNGNSDDPLPSSLSGSSSGSGSAQSLSIPIRITFQVSEHTDNLIVTIAPRQSPTMAFKTDWRFGIVVPALKSHQTSQNDEVVIDEESLYYYYFVSDGLKQAWKISPTLAPLLICFDTTEPFQQTSPDRADVSSALNTVPLPNDAASSFLASESNEAEDPSMEVDGMTTGLPQHFDDFPMIHRQSDDAVMLEDEDAFTNAPEEGAVVEAAVEAAAEAAVEAVVVAAAAADAAAEATDEAAVEGAENVAMEMTNVQVDPPAHAGAAPTTHNDDWLRERDWDLPELNFKRRRMASGDSDHETTMWLGSNADGLLGILSDGSSEFASGELLSAWVYRLPEEQFQAAILLFRGGPDGLAPHERKRDLVGAVDMFRRLATEDHHVGAMKWFSRCLRSGWGVDVDMASGNEWCRRAADAGDAFCAGLCFSFGLGCVTDLVRAHTCIMAAANAADPCGMNAAGVNFDCGEGVAKDYAASRMWYERAYNWGDIAAINNLACCYRDGHGVMRNVHRAIAMFEAAAASGDVRAMNNLGQLYSRGAEDLTVDAAAGYTWYRRAADKKNAAGMCSVGICFALGRGVPKDEAAAFDWYSRAAHLGEPAAMINLALLLRKGVRGVSRNIAVAGEWLAKAANAGNVDAIRTLAMTYLEDKTHCSTADVNKAVELFRKAAAQGDAGAMNDLGWAFDCGYIDMAECKKGESAIYWFQRSADAGCPEAYNNLGACFEGGRGVPREPLQALHYYCIAAQLGHEGAAAALNRAPFLGQSRLDGLPAPLRPQSGPSAADAPPTFVR